MLEAAKKSLFENLVLPELGLENKTDLQALRFEQVRVGAEQGKNKSNKNK